VDKIYGFTTATAGSGGFLVIVLSFCSSDCWTVRGPYWLHQACTTPVRATIATSLTWTTTCELSGLPNARSALYVCPTHAVSSMETSKKHSGGSPSHPRPHGEPSPITNVSHLTLKLTVMQSRLVYAALSCLCLPSDSTLVNLRRRYCAVTVIRKELMVDQTLA